MGARADLPWEVDGEVLIGSGTGEYLSGWFDSSGAKRIRCKVSNTLGNSGGVEIHESNNAVDVLDVSSFGREFEADLATRLWRVRVWGSPNNTFSGVARVIS